jgi:hypothetical protein
VIRGNAVATSATACLLLAANLLSARTIANVGIRRAECVAGKEGPCLLQLRHLLADCASQRLLPILDIRAPKTAADANRVFCGYRALIEGTASWATALFRRRSALGEHVLALGMLPVWAVAVADFMRPDLVRDLRPEVVRIRDDANLVREDRTCNKAQRKGVRPHFALNIIGRLPSPEVTRQSAAATGQRARARSRQTVWASHDFGFSRMLCDAGATRATIPSRAASTMDCKSVPQ